MQVPPYFWRAAALTLFALSGSLAQTLPPIAPLYGFKAASQAPARYVVVLKPGTKTLITSKAGVLSTFGLSSTQAQVSRVYSSALQGFAAQLDGSGLEQIRRDPRVAFVEVNAKFTHFGAAPTASIASTALPFVVRQEQASWGLDRIDQRSAELNSRYTALTRGTGVNVYIIDSGIQTAHPEFEGRASVGHDVLTDKKQGQDCNGHGTHVAGTVGSRSYGVARAVKLIAVRVLDCEGSGDLEGVLEGIDWVTRNHIKPAVVNMSLGGGGSEAVDQAITRSIAAGVTYVVAAGNSNADACKVSPARIPAALTVAASTRSDRRAEYSNYGACIDLFAPGSEIVSVALNGTSRQTSGTSMAAPHVAGVAALYLEVKPLATPAEVAGVLRGLSSVDLIGDTRESPNRLLHSLYRGILVK